METVKQGTFIVLRVNGSEETHYEKPTLDLILGEIGADCMDTITLDPENQQVMVVDDTGIIDGKPVNPKATALYLSICKPGTQGSICGDVAIVNDLDFD
jgi:hypothetical protein